MPAKMTPAADLTADVLMNLTQQSGIGRMGLSLYETHQPDLSRETITILVRNKGYLWSEAFYVAWLHRMIPVFDSVKTHAPVEPTQNWTWGRNRDEYLRADTTPTILAEAMHIVGLWKLSPRWRTLEQIYDDFLLHYYRLPRETQIDLLCHPGAVEELELPCPIPAPVT